VVETLDTTLQPWQSPSLVIEHVCDLGAQTLYPLHARGLGIVASSADYARQFLSRFDGAAAVFPSRTWYDAGKQPYFPAECIQAPHDAPQVAGMIWAEPTPDTAAVWMRRIDGLLSPDGVLCVVVAGRLAARVPERGGTRAFGWRKTIQLLSEHQFEIQTAFTFHGLSSYTFALLNALWARAGRPDLADRAEFRMRAAFTRAVDWRRTVDLSRISTLGFIVAARK